jgi:hypothetical protein
LKRFGSSLLVICAPLDANQLMSWPAVATNSTSLPAAAEVDTARTGCCHRSCAERVLRLLWRHCCAVLLLEQRWKLACMWAAAIGPI